MGDLNVGIPLHTVVRIDCLISSHSKMSLHKLPAYDRTKDNTRFVSILKGWIDQFALSMTNSDTKNYIQQLLIDPLMDYIFQRAFPYGIIAICIVVSMFIIVILILVLMLLSRTRCSICERALTM